MHGNISIISVIVNIQLYDKHKIFNYKNDCSQFSIDIRYVFMFCYSHIWS